MKAFSFFNNFSNFYSSLLRAGIDTTTSTLYVLMRGSESCDGSVTSAAAAFAGGAARAASSSHGRFLFCDFFSPAAPRFVALVAAAGGSLGAGARRARADARVIASARRPADDRASIARASCVRF